MPIRAQVFYLADLAAGRLLGNPCPNCGARQAERLHRKHLGMGSIFRCRRCELFFRPTGLQTSGVAKWYYSAVYGDQGLATDPTTSDRVVALARARAADKDRSALIEALLGLVPAAQRRVGVLGATWGYELLCLERLGVPLYGIEPGAPRREHGRRAFGLDLYASVEAAGEAGHRGGILMSSHVLEHIPRLSAMLDTIDRHLAPSLHVHLTPWVDPPSDDVVRVIGREHPLGVTRGFWRKHAARTGQSLRVEAHRAAEGEPYNETLAIIARPGLVSQAELDAAPLAGIQRENRTPP